MGFNHSSQNIILFTEVNMHFIKNQIQNNTTETFIGCVALLSHEEAGASIKWKASVTLVSMFYDKDAFFELISSNPDYMSLFLPAIDEAKDILARSEKWEPEEAHPLIHLAKAFVSVLSDEEVTEIIKDINKWITSVSAQDYKKLCNEFEKYMSVEAHHLQVNGLAIK